MTATAAAPSIWPGTVVACHTALQHLYGLYQSLIQTFSVVVVVLQGMEIQQTQQQREAAGVDAFMSTHRHKSIEVIAAEMMTKSSLPREYQELKAVLPAVHNRLEQQVRNTYDAKLNSRSIEQQKRWGRRRQLKLHRLVCDELRAQSNHNCFCLTLARSLCIEHQYIPMQAYDDLCREQLLVSKATLVKAKLSLKDFYPETPFEVPDDSILCSIDNLMVTMVTMVTMVVREVEDKLSTTMVEAGQFVLHRRG